MRAATKHLVRAHKSHTHTFIAEQSTCNHHRLCRSVNISIRLLNKIYGYAAVVYERQSSLAATHFIIMISMVLQFSHIGEHKAKRWKKKQKHSRAVKIGE